MEAGRSALLNEHADLSGEMALRIEKAFGLKMETTLAMQPAYSIAQARKNEKQIKVHPFAASPAM